MFTKEIRTEDRQLVGDAVRLMYRVYGLCDLRTGGLIISPADLAFQAVTSQYVLPELLDIIQDKELASVAEVGPYIRIQIADWLSVGEEKKALETAKAAYADGSLDLLLEFFPGSPPRSTPRTSTQNSSAACGTRDVNISIIDRSCSGMKVFPGLTFFAVRIILAREPRLHDTGLFRHLCSWMLYCPCQ
jgi:hypothetical protein